MQHFAPTDTSAAHHTNSPGKAQACPTLGAGRKRGRAEHGDTHARRQQGCAGLGADPSPKASAPCESAKAEAEGSTGRSLAGHWSRQQHPWLLPDLPGLQTCPCTMGIFSFWVWCSHANFGTPLRKSEKPRGQQMSQSHQTSLLLNHTNSPLKLLRRTELRECRGWEAAARASLQHLAQR